MQRKKILVFSNSSAFRNYHSNVSSGTELHVDPPTLTPNQSFFFPKVKPHSFLKPFNQSTSEVWSKQDKTEMCPQSWPYQLSSHLQSLCKKVMKTRETERATVIQLWLRLLYHHPQLSRVSFWIGGTEVD